MEKTRISTPPPAQTAPAAPTNRSKAAAPTAPGDAGAGAGSGTGGFLSLLSALGDSMDAPVDAPVDASALPVSAVDVGLLPADDGQALGADASTLMAWLTSQTVVDQTASDAADALGVGQGASTLSLAQTKASVGGQEPSLASLQAELLPPGGLVAQTARLDGAADVRAQDAQSPLAGYRRAFTRTQGGSLSGAMGSTAALATAQRGVKPLMSSPLAAPAAVVPVQAAPERRDAALAGSALPRGGLEVAAAPVATAQATAFVPDAAALARSSGERAAPGEVTQVWDGASAAPEASQSVETGAPVAEPGQTAAEDALAEQVAFWVSENLQNAELTVTHDGKPVEVSVSMSGKEAHIVFGSDQSETRELLDASVAQLRDLLHSEGLTLSGMTVGESGARNPNSGGGSDTPRGRQGGRQAQVMAPGAEIGTARPRILTETAVDLFV